MSKIATNSFVRFCGGCGASISFLRDGVVIKKCGSCGEWVFTNHQGVNPVVEPYLFVDTHLDVCMVDGVSDWQKQNPGWPLIKKGEINMPYGDVEPKQYCCPHTAPDVMLPGLLDSPLKCKIYRINKSNPLPEQANWLDAGYDVFASENVEFGLGETKLVPLGIIAEAPKGYHFKLFIRSSIPYKRGFCIANSVGIIDSEYCGPKDEIQIMLRAPYAGTKFDLREHVITAGERIGQLILERNVGIEWDEQDSPDFAESSRGGFGSSGE